MAIVLICGLYELSWPRRCPRRTRVQSRNSAMTLSAAVLEIVITQYSFF